MTANFREVLAHDLTANLDSGPHERPIDRIAAFGKGKKLGTLLWRLRYANDATCFKAAILLLAKETSLQSQTGTRLCELAIREFLLPMCETCRGAKEMILAAKRLPCPNCGGLGSKRFSDEERELFLKTKFAPWAKKFSAVWDRMTSEETAVNSEMSRQLERK